MRQGGEWGELPKGAVDYENGGCVRREKVRKVNLARDEVYDKCLDFIEERYKGEPKWNEIWVDLFKCIMTEKRKQ